MMRYSRVMIARVATMGIVMWVRSSMMYRYLSMMNGSFNMMSGRVMDHWDFWMR